MPIPSPHDLRADIRCVQLAEKSPATEIEIERPLGGGDRYAEATQRGRRAHFASS
jgi:hypothetical protein